ncbi:hypothetical protein GYMLUDRAFT_511220 [Collybiopsis luxurians FD-317 M1]|nr:hypothetical protein GYMLUDRAFT_511220 [Collybiopsis luxurians FD-317 M1]
MLDSVDRISVEKSNIEGNGLQYIATPTRVSTPVNRPPPAAPAPAPAPVDTADPPPPSYEASSFSQQISQELQTYKANNQQMSCADRSSFYFKFSVGSSLRLEGSVLHASCRNVEGSGSRPSKLDLNEHIGIVDGRLVWGRLGFFSVCRNVRLQEFVLYAECESESNVVVQSTLDLTRYLYVYNGVLCVKVDAAVTDLSMFFTATPWLKYKGRLVVARFP